MLAGAVHLLPWAEMAQAGRGRSTHSPATAGKYEAGRARVKRTVRRLTARTPSWLTSFRRPLLMASAWRSPYIMKA